MRQSSMIGALVREPEPPTPERDGDGYTVRIDEHCRLEHLPLSLPVLVDLDSDGLPDYRAEYGLKLIDVNRNDVVDAGDRVHFGAPRLIPLGTGARLVWCEAHTFLGVEQIVRWMWGCDAGK